MSLHRAIQSVTITAENTTRACGRRKTAHSLYLIISIHGYIHCDLYMNVHFLSIRGVQSHVVLARCRAIAIENAAGRCVVTSKGISVEGNQLGHKITASQANRGSQ